MNVSKVLTSVVAIGMFGVAVAQDEARVKIEVVTDHDDGDGIHVQFDSEDAGFNLHDMQVGENQAIVDDEGRTILVTREADGFTFDVEGKSIKMPMIGSDHEQMMKLHGDHEEGFEVHVVHNVLETVGDHDELHQVKVVKKVEVVTE